MSNRYVACDRQHHVSSAVRIDQSNVSRHPARCDEVVISETSDEERDPMKAVNGLLSSSVGGECTW